MIEYVFAFIILSFFSFFGAFIVFFMAFTCSIFEETELGTILAEKIRSWFERDVELIRCKECKFYRDFGEKTYCAHRHGLKGQPCEDDHCSRAERMDEE